MIIKKNDGIKRNIYILKNISETAVMRSQRSRLPLYLGHKPVVDVARPMVDVDVARPVVDVAELKKQFDKLTDDVAKLKYAQRELHNCKSKLCINMTGPNGCPYGLTCVFAHSHAELIPLRKDKLPTKRGNRGRGRGRGRGR